MRVRAALIEAPGGPFTIRDVDLAPPRDDEILVRITAAGLCHTDLAMRHGWRRFPMVFGHEGAGVVEAVGDAVTGPAPGDTVCLSYRSCGACEQCAAGNPAYCLCSDLNLRGTRAGTILNVLRPSPGETVAVLGAGAVGLCAVMAAVALGADVIVVEPVPARRDLARELGATATIDPTAGAPPTRDAASGGPSTHGVDSGDVAAALRKHGGAHYAIDTTGRPGVIAQALRGLRRRGTLALVGMGGTAEVDIMTVMANGIVVRGVIEGDADPADFIPRLIDLHRRGRLPLEKLVVEYPFEEIEAAARDAASGRTTKPVLIFRGR